MTVVAHQERRGYAASLAALLRLALARTDRPRRDCAITLHAAVRHSPEAMEEMVKRLGSGGELVVAELMAHRGAASPALRLARSWTPRLLPVAGLKDTVSGFVALRLIVLRQAMGRGTGPFLVTDGWCASAELLMRLAPHARRIDAVPATARYDLAQRPSRVRPWHQLLEAWRARPLLRAARTAAVALVLLATGLRAQADTVRGAPLAGTAAPPIGAIAPAVNFPVGRRLVYGAWLGAFSVGAAPATRAAHSPRHPLCTLH